MQATCRNHWCKQAFEITSEDRILLKELSPVYGGKTYEIPVPDLCPRCRMQARLARRNERFLYHRKCDLTGKQIISCYSTDKPFPVYENDEWYSDKWDAREYGVDIDFGEPFFGQFAALQSRVPRMARILERPYENSDYCNTASQVKNCYLLFSSNQDEDCYYGSWINQCDSCVDNLNLEHCELCYECVGCRDCYALRYCRDCVNCRDSFFLRDCQGCAHCFGCTNQVNKQYVIFNEQKTKEQYEEFLERVNTGKHSEVQQARERIEAMLADPVVKEMHGVGNENCSGDYLRNCKNAVWCFECNNVEDCRYCQCLQNGKSSMDHTYWGQGSELVYFCQACGYDPYHLLFCNLCWHGCSELLYCDHSFASKNCFGCSGLRKSEYCILNKQYTQEEYEELVPRVIAHMRSTGEWGQFFPPGISVYAYNETLAQEHVPMTKEEVLRGWPADRSAASADGIAPLRPTFAEATVGGQGYGGQPPLRRGWKWLDEEAPEKKYLGPAYEIPDDIADIDDEICARILHCEATGKPFKIIPQELKFLRQQRIPIPRLHPDERHRRRLMLRNPRKLWKRNCAKCQKEIQTTYAPDRPEIVYCESCYLSTVY